MNSIRFIEDENNPKYINWYSLLKKAQINNNKINFIEFIEDKEQP